MSFDNADPRGFVAPFYREPHRFYHGESHLETVLAALGPSASAELRHAALFHDVIYDPWASDNEERSCDLFRTWAATHAPQLDADRVCALIMATKDHRTPAADAEGRALQAADLAVFSDPAGLDAYETGIFREYQKAPLATYRERRLAFLESMAAFFGPQSPEGRNCRELIDRLAHRVWRVGYYAGSFNPFHVGHLDICLQAERVFDKVVIAQGINREKTRPEPVVSRLRQVLPYDGLIVSLFEPEPHCEKTLIRGLRNSFDVGYEDNLRNTILDIRPVSIVYFFCQKQHEHISSSMVRSLEPFGDTYVRKYLPDLI